jgi:hypothetical protein
MENNQTIPSLLVFPVNLTTGGELKKIKVEGRGKK